MPGIRRLLVVLAVSSACVWLGSAPALAAGNPDRQPNLPLPPPFTQPMCGPGIGDVTVSIDPNTFRATFMTFTQRDGTTKIEFTGYAEQIVQGNGKTLKFNVSGPGAILINADGSIAAAVFGGENFYIGPVGTPQQGLALYSGHVSYAIIDTAAYGPIFVVSSFTGHSTDVCALLAA
jgi:hypothetical protein